MWKEYGLILLLCFAIAGVSFWTGRQTAPQSPLTRLEQDIKTITEVDLVDYRNQTDRQKQLEKAEEILAKILQIFIADLGLRIAQADVDKMANQPPSTSPPQNSTADHQTVKSQAPTPNASNEEPRTDWRRLEADLAKVKTPKEQDEFLQNVTLENFFSTIRNSVPPPRKSMEGLVGTHKGQLVFMDRGRPSKDVELTIELDGDLNRATGKYTIIISQDGNKESHTSGSGGFRDFSTTSESAAIIIRATPNSYMQLYYSAGSGTFFGNSYGQESIDKYTLEGRVFLK